MLLERTSTDLTVQTALRGGLLPFAAIVSAAPVAFALHVVYGRFQGRPETAVMLMGVLIGIVLAAALALIARRFRHEPHYGAVGAILAVGIVLVAIYLFSISSAVAFPADILTWSESDFVNDILKFRVGYPLYTADINNDSFTYSFGTQLVTYMLAAVAGFGTSIPAYRCVQILFTVMAAYVGMISVRRICRATLVDVRYPILWQSVAFVVLFLIATNPITNPYTHNLHNDALAQLITAVAYYLLLRYAEGPSRRLMLAMAVLPAIGFLSKQSLLAWAGLYCVYFAFFDGPFSLRRLATFVIGTAAAIAIVLGICLAIWGPVFFYWTFTVLGKHAVSPLRSFDHLLRIWPYVGAGLFGGAVLSRSPGWKKLAGSWTIWLLLIVGETYTSGVAWMLNHIGPGCLIAGVWLLAGLMSLWHTVWQHRPSGAFEASIATAGVCLVFAGMGLIRIPLPAVPSDARRYVQAIEREFQGQSTGKVLLDAGTWLYATNGIVMKDRAPTIGERGFSATGDFSGILNRINTRRYDKILLRNYHRGDFWYDHKWWQTPSGIRKALNESYEETGTIRAVESGPASEQIYLFSDVSILIPKHSGKGL